MSAVRSAKAEAEAEAKKLEYEHKIQGIKKESQRIKMEKEK